jgi:hypothetical protein
MAQENLVGDLVAIHGVFKSESDIVVIERWTIDHHRKRVMPIARRFLDRDVRVFLHPVECLEIATTNPIDVPGKQGGCARSNVADGQNRVQCA